MLSPYRPNWSPAEDAIVASCSAAKDATTRARIELRRSGYTRSLSAIYSRIKTKRNISK